MIDQREVTNQLLEMLRRGTAIPVGDHKAPKQGVLDPEDDYPYAILYEMEGGAFSGPALTAPEADADFRYQVTCVGTSRSQARWAADRVRRTMVDREPTGAFKVSYTAPPGVKLTDRLLIGGSGYTEVDGDPPNELYSIPTLYALGATPS